MGKGNEKTQRTIEEGAHMYQWRDRILRWWRWLIEWLFPTSDVFYVDGRYLYDNCRSKVILRGINLPLVDDWDFPGNDKLGELAKTKANAVRIQWYAQYPNQERPPYDISHLDAFLEKCRDNSLIPIVELHDCTCASDPELVNTQLMSWWTRSDVVSVLRKHERYLIINLANELGSYRWQNRSTAALDNFKNAYKKAITGVRNQNLRMPIMIDAPDCGTSIDAFTRIGQELIDHDPWHSLLLSVHAYWGGDYDGTNEIDKAFKANLPIVFGEIANKQYANEDECYYGLDGTGINHPPPTGFRYQNLLALLAGYEIGWLAWSWYPDKCANRRMTPDGNYTGKIDGSPTGLTTYGEDIVHNGSYGLRLGLFRAKQTQSLPVAWCLFWKLVSKLFSRYVRSQPPVPPPPRPLDISKDEAPQ
jgi:mannan endo-1,4-beta-mannosidase